MIVHLSWRGTATKTKAESHPHRAVDCRFVTGETRLGITHIQFAGAVTSENSPVAAGWGFEPPRGFANQAPGLGAGGVTSAGAGGGGVTGAGVSGIGAAGVGVLGVVGVLGAGLGGTGGAASDGTGVGLGLGEVRSPPGPP